MAYSCDICGKGKLFGKNVPFSLHKTNKVWKPNLQKQYIELGDSRVQVKICTQCLRTLKKYRTQNDAALAETAPTEAAKPKATRKPATKKPAAAKAE